MRLWLIIGGLVVVGVLVVVIPQLGGDEPHTPRRGHPEALAAATALVYARGMEVGDVTIACGTMTKDAGRAVGCGTHAVHPRSCGRFDIEATQILEYGRSRAAVAVGTCRIELVPGAVTSWAVSEVTPA